MTLDYSKKGIIILSHYRSGGTQLLSILSMVLDDINIEHHNCGEIEVRSDNLNFIDTINSRFFNRPDDKFSIHLLNSPLSINQLYYSGSFKKLNEQYICFAFFYLKWAACFKCCLFSVSQILVYHYFFSEYLVP